MINPDGTITYTPDPDFTGSDTFTYTVTVTNSDGSTSEETATVNVTVDIDTDGDGLADIIDPDDDNDGNPDTTDPNPLVPTAINDELTLVEGETATVNILENDDYLPGSNTSITNTGTGTASGIIAFDPLTGIMEYTPAESETGSEVTVVYQVCNTEVTPNVCETATVSILVLVDDIDTDGDGILDSDENTNGTDPLNPCDPNPAAVLSGDCDGDGILNEFEVGTDPNNLQDTDGDGTPDILDIDDDGDGIDTVDEGADPNNDGNPNDAFDSDGNGTPDYLEFNNADTTEEDDLEVFQLITADGDGVNDILVIRNIENYPDNTVKIFNRWGVLVWETKGYNPENNYFIGKSNGRVTITEDEYLPVGTYFYIISYNADNNDKEKAGYIYINR